MENENCGGILNSSVLNVLHFCVMCVTSMRKAMLCLKATYIMHVSLNYGVGTSYLYLQIETLM